MKVQTEVSKINGSKKSNYTTMKMDCFRVKYPITFRSSDRSDRVTDSDRSDRNDCQ